MTKTTAITAPPEEVYVLVPCRVLVRDGEAERIQFPSLLQAQAMVEEFRHYTSFKAAVEDLQGLLALQECER